MKKGGLSFVFDGGVERAVAGEAGRFAGGVAAFVCDFAGAMGLFVIAGADALGFAFDFAVGGGCIPYRDFDGADAEVDVDE